LKQNLIYGKLIADRIVLINDSGWKVTLQMKILVVNDDGILAPGLITLANAMLPLGEVTVLAPEKNWSISGHVKTLHKPLRLRKVNLSEEFMAYASDGSPSDCVALALLGAIESKFDLVVSGINPNANIGDDVTYSGTVTAAMEACIAGIPGIAFSLDSPENHAGTLDYETTGAVASKVIKEVILNGLPKGVLLNVNVPYCSYSELSGFMITRQGVRIYRDALDKRNDPRGKPYFWIGGQPPIGVDEEGTDYGALKAGFVSITPLQLDLTAYSNLNNIKQWDFSL
jgi:5'-nucleotidase